MRRTAGEDMTAGQMLITPECSARLERATRQLPERSREGLLAYFRYGVRPGSFLYAVLTNDLSGAFLRADPWNKAALERYIAVLREEAPIGTWGDEQAVDQWIQLGALRRARLAEEAAP